MSDASLAADGLPPLREVVRQHGLEPRKALGQNFLFDLNLTGRIARAAGPLDDATVFEVGPGPGGLTRALLQAGARRVVAVERDRRCLAALTDVSAHSSGRLTVIEGDALAVDPAVAAEAGRPLRVVANLPYNIGTALLTRWLTSASWPPRFDRLVLMFQREVADRIVATPAQRADYGRLAVLCAWRTRARILFDVPAAAFVPPPKVTSAVVEIVPRPDPAPCRVDRLEALTLAAFGQRRKMLRQSLRSLSDLSARIDVGDFLHRCGIEGTRRAEEVDVAGFVTMARLWDDLSLRAGGGPQGPPSTPPGGSGAAAPP